MSQQLLELEKKFSMVLWARERLSWDEVDEEKEEEAREKDWLLHFFSQSF